MSATSGQPAEGTATQGIMALLLVLVGLLEWMAAGSRLLIGSARGEMEPWLMTASVMGLIGLANFVLALGILRLEGWVRFLAVLLTLLVLAYGVLRMVTDPVLSLSTALVFMLAMGTNLGLLAWLHLPDTLQRFAEREALERGVP